MSRKIFFYVADSLCASQHERHCIVRTMKVFLCVHLPEWKSRQSVVLKKLCMLLKEKNPNMSAILTKKSKRKFTTQVNASNVRKFLF